MTETLTYSGQLVIEVCPTCQMRHGVPVEVQERARKHPGRNGWHVYCPAGHSYWYGGKTDADKARERAQRAEERAARLSAELDQAQADANHQRNRVRGYQGQLAKTKKRAAAGVCPAPGCKRSFADVARHVARQHPDFQPTHTHETDAP